MPERIALSNIKADEAAQPRAEIDAEKVGEYAERMKAGDVFPPLTVFRQGTNNWLADGFHRRQAALEASLEHFECEVRQGNLRDAILFSAGANAKHGLSRSNDDKRRAVTNLLEDSQWSKWSDGEIAARAVVSDRYVSKLRDELGFATANVQSETRLYRTKHGSVSTMRAGKIGKRRKATAKTRLTQSGIKIAPADPQDQTIAADRSPSVNERVEDGADDPAASLVELIQPLDSFCRANDAADIGRSVPKDALVRARMTFVSGWLERCGEVSPSPSLAGGKQDLH